MKHVGMYIHIPFCKRKCNYCDFNSYDNQKMLIIEYIKYLKQEIKDVGQGIISDEKEGYNTGVTIDTIYIGGGTPSFIDSKYIEEIVKVVKENYTIIEDPEITIEVNPGTANKEKLQAYKNCGINRCSIGLQSSNDDLLRMLGRIHNFNDFKETYRLAREVGFNNINVDFMIGLPNQTLEDIDNMVDIIKEIQPEHVSVYSLIVEEGTKISKQIENSELKLPDEELERSMYWKVKEGLEQIGFEHYEISNFAKPGFKSKHNSDCWEQKEYIGLGCGAHSYTDNVRFSNVDNIEEYIYCYKNDLISDSIIFHEKQNKESKMNEYMMLGLRKIKGVEYEQFENKFKIDLRVKYQKQIDKLRKLGLIELNDKSIYLTNKGIDLANIVWEEFV